MEGAATGNSQITTAVTAGVVGAVVVISGAVIGVIVAVTSGGTAAAAAASALLVKYGLEFRKRNSQLEVNIEKMCSSESIKVKDAPDLPLNECVEFIIASSSSPDEEEDDK